MQSIIVEPSPKQYDEKYLKRLYREADRQAEQMQEELDKGIEAIADLINQLAEENKKHLKTKANNAWITVHPNGKDAKGQHLQINEGEDLRDALKRKTGKDNPELEGVKPKSKPLKELQADEAPKGDKLLDATAKQIAQYAEKNKRFKPETLARRIKEEFQYELGEKYGRYLDKELLSMTPEEREKLVNDAIAKADEAAKSLHDINGESFKEALKDFTRGYALRYANAILKQNGTKNFKAIDIDVFNDLMASAKKEAQSNIEKLTKEYKRKKQTSRDGLRAELENKVKALEAELEKDKTELNFGDSENDTTAQTALGQLKWDAKQLALAHVKLNVLDTVEGKEPKAQAETTSEGPTLISKLSSKVQNEGNFKFCNLKGLDPSIAKPIGQHMIELRQRFPTSQTVFFGTREGGREAYANEYIKSHIKNGFTDKEKENFSLIAKDIIAQARTISRFSMEKANKYYDRAKRLESAIADFNGLSEDDKKQALHLMGYIESDKQFAKLENAFAYSSNWPPDFEGITLCSELFKDANKYKKALRDGVVHKFHPAGTDNIESIVTHEYGHEIDKAYGITRFNSNLTAEQKAKAKKLQAYIAEQRAKGAEYVKENLGEYAGTNDAEFFAEAFSEYMNNPEPREIAKTVGTMLEELTHGKK